MIVPTLCVGMPQGTLRVPALGDAERPGLHSHAERGNDQRVSNEDSCGSEPARECGLSVTVASTGGLLSRAGSLPLLMRYGCS